MLGGVLSLVCFLRGLQGAGRSLDPLLASWSVWGYLSCRGAPRKANENRKSTKELFCPVNWFCCVLVCLSALGAVWGHLGAVLEIARNCSKFYLAPEDSCTSNVLEILGCARNCSKFVAALDQPWSSLAVTLGTLQRQALSGLSGLPGCRNCQNTRLPNTFLLLHLKLAFSSRVFLSASAELSWNALRVLKWQRRGLNRAKLIELGVLLLIVAHAVPQGSDSIMHPDVEEEYLLDVELCSA